MTSDGWRARPPQLTAEGAATWQDADAVAAYVHRAPYPEALFPRLAAEASGGRVLELGCGSGAITRRLAPLVEAIDAVDFSPLMLAEGRRLPGGSQGAIRWVEGAAESVPLDGPYALVVAGASLHWMDWEIVVPRIAGVLAPGARLCIVANVVGRATAWRAAEDELFPAFSIFEDFEHYELGELLEQRGLWSVEERATVGPELFEQVVDDYVEQFHSNAGFRRAAMGEMRTREFDERLRALVTPYAAGGRLTLDVVAETVFGRPGGVAGVGG